MKLIPCSFFLLSLLRRRNTSLPSTKATLAREYKFYYTRSHLRRERDVPLCIKFKRAGSRFCENALKIGEISPFVSASIDFTFVEQPRPIHRRKRASKSTHAACFVFVNIGDLSGSIYYYFVVSRNWLVIQLVGTVWAKFSKLAVENGTRTETWQQISHESRIEIERFSVVFQRIDVRACRRRKKKKKEKQRKKETLLWFS